MSMIKYFEKTPTTIPMFEDLGIYVDQEGNVLITRRQNFPAQFVVWRCFVGRILERSIRFTSMQIFLVHWISSSWIWLVLEAKSRMPVKIIILRSLWETII